MTQFFLALTRINEEDKLELYGLLERRPAIGQGRREWTFEWAGHDGGVLFDWSDLEAGLRKGLEQTIQVLQLAETHQALRLLYMTQACLNDMDPTPWPKHVWYFSYDSPDVPFPQHQVVPQGSAVQEGWGWHALDEIERKVKEEDRPPCWREILEEIHEKHRRMALFS